MAEAPRFLDETGEDLRVVTDHDDSAGQLAVLFFGGDAPALAVVVDVVAEASR